jgi:hypothetical protein
MECLFVIRRAPEDSTGVTDAARHGYFAFVYRTFGSSGVLPPSLGFEWVRKFIQVYVHEDHDKTQNLSTIVLYPNVSTHVLHEDHIRTVESALIV